MMNRDNTDDLLSDVRGFAEAALTPPPDAISTTLLHRLESLIDSDRLKDTPFPPMSAFPNGPAIAGFRMEEEVGRGGMGVVYRAWDEGLARYVAVKVLSAVADPNQLESFRREAQAAATVRSDHVVPIYSADRTSDGRPFLVMPLIAGQTLRDRLRSAPTLPREAACLIREIALGLSSLHSAGLLHRDIKPANVLVDALDGRAKLTDFGLARAAANSGATRVGVISGTPEYMSPEQASAPETLDVRSDIYSLGVSLYECLTGTIPFRGSPLDIIRQRGESDPAPPRRLNSRVPKDLETICLKAIAPERTRRYPTAAAFAEDLERWLSGRAISARPNSWAEMSVRWMRRHPLPVAILAIVVIGGVISALGWSRAATNARLAEERREAAERSAEAERLQRERGEQHLATARSAVDRFYLRIIEEGLLSDPKLQLQRREMLADAAHFYERMLALETSDEKLHRSAIATAFHLGLILRDLGRNDEAEATLRRSALLARGVLERDPGDDSSKRTLLKSLNTLRTILWGMRKIEEAHALDGECLTLCQELVAAHPEDIGVRRNLAAMSANSASAALVLGDKTAARTDLLVARTHFEQLVKLRPDEATYRADVARTEFNLGYATDLPEESLQYWERSRKLRRELLPKYPNLNHIRTELVKNCLQLSESRMNRREYAEALDAVSEAIHQAREHLALTEDVPVKQMLADSLTLRADALHQLTRINEADRAFSDASEVHRSLMALDASRFLGGAIQHAKAHAEFLNDRDRGEEAKKILAEAAKRLDETIRAAPAGSANRTRLEKLRESMDSTETK